MDHFTVAVTCILIALVLFQCVNLLQRLCILADGLTGRIQTVAVMRIKLFPASPSALLILKYIHLYRLIH